MKVIRVNDLDGVKFTGGTSFRAVLQKDNVGFAVMKTVIPKGGPHKWYYEHHKEVCYCIKGRAILTNLTNDVKTMITPDVCYIVDQHEPHSFEALEDTVLISIFNPPLQGKETHDKNGTYQIPVTSL